MVRIAANKLCGIFVIDDDEVRDDEVLDLEFLTSFQELDDDSELSTWVSDVIFAALDSEYVIH